MASLTIRNLEDSLKERLRVRAARHGRSMEEEARQLLRRAVLREKASAGLGTRIARRFTEAGIELPEATRAQPRPAPAFGSTDDR